LSLEVQDDIEIAVAVNILDVTGAMRLATRTLARRLGIPKAHARSFDRSRIEHISREDRDWSSALRAEGDRIRNTSWFDVDVDVDALQPVADYINRVSA
jgi:hypothetical protein